MSPARGSTLQRLASSARRWQWWVALGIVERLVAFVLDPNPLLYGDSGVYLRAAVQPGPYAIQPKGAGLFWRLVGAHVTHILVANFILTLVIAYAAWRLCRRMWVPAFLILSPLTVAYERLMMAEHLFAALLTVGVLLLARKSALTGLLFGLAAVTRMVGLVLAAPMIVFLARRWQRALPAVGLFAVVVAWYSASYVYPATGAHTITFLGPNAISVVAPLVDCPPAPADICAWKHAEPNAIIFDQRGPLQTRIRTSGWKGADAQLRPVVIHAIVHHPLEYLIQYAGRIPHLFSLRFFYEQGGAPPLYGPSVQALARIDGGKPRPSRGSARTRAWDAAVKVFTIVGGIVVVAGFASWPRAEISVTCAIVLLASIAFNDATARFLYPVIPLMAAGIRRPPLVERLRTRGLPKNPRRTPHHPLS